MKAVSETKRFNDSWAKRMAYDCYMDKVRWNNALKEEAEAQRKQDEVQRKQDEAYRRETERIAVETEWKAAEVERKAAEVEHEKEEAAGRLRKAYSKLLSAGIEASKAAELLDIDPSDIPPSAEP